MELNELETLLASLKGEENAFALYNGKKKREIRQIAELFLATRDYNIEKLNSIIKNVSGMGPKSKRVVSLYGEKGVGKSTALSIFLLDNLLKGNIDGIVYYRYDSKAEEFKEIFNVNGEAGGKVVACVDDMTYYSSALAQGRAVDLTKGIEERARIYRSSGTRLFIYISDLTHATFLSTLETKILEKVGRGDLVYSMPKMSVGSAGAGNKDEVTLDNSFYGKTYALLKGNLEFYGLGVLFGELIRESENVLADNPRLLKFLIKQIESKGGDIDRAIFADKELGKQVLRSGQIDSAKAIEHFNEQARKEIGTYYRGLADHAHGVENEHKKMMGLLLDLQSDIVKIASIDKKKLEAYPYLREMITKDFAGADGKIGLLRDSMQSSMKALREELARVLKCEEENPLSGKADISELWSVHAKEAYFYSQRVRKLVGKIEKQIDLLLGSGAFAQGGAYDSGGLKVAVRAMAISVDRRKTSGLLRPNTDEYKMVDDLFYISNAMLKNLKETEGLLDSYRIGRQIEEMVEQTGQNAI
ncbi:MAG: hypothetical protein KGH71_04030, partial [Candidatus Micrarchaeota archaeon]|nr:hypothetical protein [Candidatus Micrarchaeota archaeon]